MNYSYSDKSAYWCDNCQIPVVGRKCFACNGETKKICSYLRPVYKAEINYLINIFGADIPFELNELDVWVSSNNSYYIRGKKAFQITGYSQINNEIKCKIFTKIFPEYRRRSTDEIKAALRLANEGYLRDIQYESESFIKEIAKKFSQRTQIVSFSGGKDSTVVSHLVMSAFGRSDQLHVFADTTIEAVDTYEYIELFKKIHPLTPLIICKSPLDFFSTATQIGVPSRILRWCCTTHKTNPLTKVVNSINPFSGVLAFDGVRKAESARRSKYSRVTLKHKVAGEILASPILEWSETQLWLYILYHDLHINESYMKGFRRVGCLYCPYNSGWSELMQQYHYPEQYNTWIQFLKSYAIKTNHPSPEIFVTNGWRVRAGGRGLDNYKTVLETYPCALSEDAFTYQIVSGTSKNIKEYLIPLGPQRVIYSDNYSEIFIISDPTSLELRATVEISYEEESTRVTYLDKKSKLVLKRQIEKQLIKLQSCIKCGACSAICPTKANKLDIAKTIEKNLCNYCLKCVTHNCPAVESLKRKGKGF